MITDLQIQHELLKTALEATDNYLFVEKRATEQGMATNQMIHDFTYEMSRAHDALQALGVLDQHQDYMSAHANVMLKLHGHKDQSLADIPYTHVPAADVGEVEESVSSAYDRINKRFTKTSGQTLGQKHKYWSGEVERLGKEIEAQKAEVERRKKLEVKEAVWDQAKERQDLPKEKLSPASKAKAKARAKAAGRPYPNMVDNIWAARMQEGKALSFNQFISEEEKKSSESEDTISDEEIDQIVDDLTWEDIVDLYDEIELEYDPEEDDEEEELDEELLDEKLSVQARLKKRQAFARMRGKRNVARGIKLRRASSIEVLKKRAKLAARRAVYKRFLRGRDKSTLSAAEKDRIEQQVARMKFMQQAIQVKLLPKMRAIEQKRLAGYRTKKSTAPGGSGSSRSVGSKAPKGAGVKSKSAGSKAPRLKK